MEQEQDGPPPESDDGADVYDIANERILIGGLIIKPAAFEWVREEIEADDLFDPIHRRLFEALQASADAGDHSEEHKIDLPRLVDALGGDPKAEIEQGKTVAQYIAGLAAGTSLGEDFRGIARYLRTLAMQRNEDYSETGRPVFEPESVFGAMRWEHLDVPGEELEQIIDGFFTTADKSIIAGPSQSGKSFLAIHAGFVVALQAVRDKLPRKVADRLPDFFGHKVLRPGLVVYQAGEGARGVKNRLRALRKYFEIPADLHLPFVVLTKTVDLYRQGDAGDVNKLIKEINAWHLYYEMPLAMFFLDTWSTATAGADENSAKDMTAAMGNCEKIKQATGAHVAIVHHMNAGGSKVRGHSSLYANMDQVILVERDPATKIRTAKLDKQKDDEAGKVIRFELKSVELYKRASDSKMITSCVCLEVGEKDAKRYEGKMNAFNVSERERHFLTAMFKALKDNGIPVTAEMAAPSSVTHVATVNDIKVEFAKLVWPDIGDDDLPEEEKRRRFDQRVRTAMSTAGKSLVRFGVIGRDQKWVWWSGRAVNGFPQTFKRDETSKPEPDLPPDVDHFLASGGII